MDWGVLSSASRAGHGLGYRRALKRENRVEALGSVMPARAAALDGAVGKRLGKYRAGKLMIEALVWKFGEIGVWGGCTGIDSDNFCGMI